MPTARTLMSYLPLAIFIGVMCWRMRTMDKARPLRLRTLWVMPVLFVLLVGFIVFSMPPGRIGIVNLVLGGVIGAGIGWQRARLLRLHLEGEGAHAKVMMRQSRAALLLLMALAGVRTLARSATGAAPMAGGFVAVHASDGSLAFTDGMLGFALGIIVAQRLGLWRRARMLMSGGNSRMNVSID